MFLKTKMFIWNAWLLCNTVKTKRFCECWKVCLQVTSCKFYLYLKDNKSKSLQSWYILLLKYWFLHESKHIYFLMWQSGEFSALLPKQHWLCKLRKVIEDALILFANKVSHRKLNVLTFHRQVFLFFVIIPKIKKKILL